jgi:flagellar biosynthesis protein FlhA
MGDVGGAAALFGVLALTVVPLPPTLLDLLLGTSLVLSVLVFLVAAYIEKPLEFSAFPSLLLFITLFRLGLNIATTRIILLDGGGGEHAAGRVIDAFGKLAVGGNFVVGAVVFLILVVINFIVITKGAERISEVAARFTLDSMPGKQMAIDADLGAGMITEKEARVRRADVEREADFHGSMDGASKFVRGDAVAGLIIVGINCVAGMIIGVAQHDLSFGEAATVYTTLSIGDGLVSQIPGLLVSTGAALLATRGNGEEQLGPSLGKQLLGRSKPMMGAAGVLATIGFIPGMPTVAFLALSAGLYALARRTRRTEGQTPAFAGAAAAAADGASAAPRADGPAEQKAEIEHLLPVDLLGLDVGLDLIPMLAAARGGELLGRIAALRKQMALELGFIVPPAHVRDDLRLRPGAYRILISGTKVAEGEVRAGRLLAIDPAERAIGIPGEMTREPTFGLPAKWIAAADRNRAEAAGCTVVDASAVIATHLTEIVRRHAAELLGRREAQEILELAGKTNSKVVEELIPHIMGLGEVIKVLRGLLAEGVSIRDMRTILEALADHGGAVKDPAELTELVRQRLGRAICRTHLADDGELRALVLDPRAEDLFRQGGRGGDPGALSRLTAALEDAARAAADRDDPAVLVVAPDVRRGVSQVALRHIPGLAVLSYREIDPPPPLVTRAVIGTPAARAKELS